MLTNNLNGPAVGSLPELLVVVGNCAVFSVLSFGFFIFLNPRFQVSILDIHSKKPTHVSCKQDCLFGYTFE